MERKHKALIQTLARITFEGQESSLQARIKEVVDFLIHSYPRDAKHFLEYYGFCLLKEYKNRYAVLEYAHQLQSELLEQIKAQVLSDRNTQWVAEEKPELLGGFRFQIGDNRWDVSLKGQLENIKQHLS